MSVKMGRVVPNRVTRTLICVDRAGESDFSGRMYNPYMPEVVFFSQVKDIIIGMEGFLNDIQFPQSSFDDRSFLESRAGKDDGREQVELRRYQDDGVFERETGRVATFELQVRYRQAATWQGELFWKERRQREKFRSALEFLRMMSRALALSEFDPD